MVINTLAKMWRGNVGLPKMFWLYGVTANLAYAIIITVIINYVPLYRYGSVAKVACITFTLLCFAYLIFSYICGIKIAIVQSTGFKRYAYLISATLLTFVGLFLFFWLCVALLASLGIHTINIESA